MKKIGIYRVWLPVLGAVCAMNIATSASALSTDTESSTNHITLSVASSLSLDSGSEIVAFDETTYMAYVTTPDAGLVLVDMSDPSNPAEMGSVLTTELINSVAVHNGLVAVAIESGTSTAGSVAFLNSAGVESNRVTVGITPDNVVFSPDGTMVLTADEAETADHEDYGAGTISVITVNNVTDATVTTLGFEGFDSQTNTLRSAGVRIFPGRLPSVDFEPEYVAVSADNTEALVTLQENNAMAVVDLTTLEITDIVPLGLKDWSDSDNTLDAGDKDDCINITNYPFFGMYMPDTVVSYEVGGVSYYVIANEGDSRDYGDADEIRLEDVTLDPDTFADWESLQTDATAGRLKISQIDADTDGDGDYDVVYAYGGRSFSILDADGSMVYDSADDFETYIAANYPELHNVNDCSSDEFDKRSDDKGCEPEAAKVGVINGVSYAFIGLERVGGVMVYNVSNPENPVFVQFARLDGDVAPEGFDFVSEEDSPNGMPLLLVANEDSHTLTVYEIEINESATTDNGTSIEWLAQYDLTSADDELDVDGDGLDSSEEYEAGTDPTDTDSDDDSMDDSYELEQDLDPTDSSDASADADGDGLSNSDEYANDTDPYMEDSDVDLMDDSWELTHSLDPLVAQDMSADEDGDGDSDIDEYNYGTDPQDASDSFELMAGVSSEAMFTLDFGSVNTHRYVIQTSDDLNVWHNDVVVDGSNDVVGLDYEVESKGFFRVSGAVDEGAPVAKICVISDPHYLAPSLMNTNSPDFQAYLEEDRKLIAESHDIMVSVLASIVEEQPDILLIPGDLTKDGEKISHQGVASLLAEVEAAGIEVVICPGNHDINNDDAVGYTDAGSTNTATVTAAEFAEIYDSCGYSQAIRTHDDSLSFVAEPVDGLWIMSIDSCIYEPSQITAGEVSSETLSWMEEVMADAVASNATVLAMMHHGVVPHYDYQTALFSEYVVSNYTEVETALIDGNVGTVFTGHYHANDVVRNDSNELFDVETGSTVTWPCPYRVIFMNANGVLDIGTKYIEEVDGVDDFQDYAEAYLEEGLAVLSSNLLVNSYGLSVADATVLAPAMTATFKAHYAGDEDFANQDAYTAAVQASLLSSTNAMNQLFGAVIYSMWDDPEPADNEVFINTRTGGAADQ